jgi:hypothetical protein
MTKLLTMGIIDVRMTERTPTKPKSQSGGSPSCYFASAIAGGTMAKLHTRPSLQYRYEHYDPASEY